MTEFDVGDNAARHKVRKTSDGDVQETGGAGLAQITRPRSLCLFLSALYFHGAHFTAMRQFGSVVRLHAQKEKGRIP